MATRDRSRPDVDRTALANPRRGGRVSDGDAATEGALARYRLLFEQSRDIILFIALDGRIVDANPAALAAYGYDRDVLTTMSIADLRDTETAGDVREQIRRADSEGILFETRHRRRDGTTFPVEVSSLGADFGRERLLLSVVRDISARTQANAVRERLHAERDALLDSAAEGIFGMDANGDCTFINPAAIRMLGFTPEDVLGRDMHGLIHHSRPDGSPYPIEECPINTAFEAGQNLHLVEEVLWRKDGTSFPALYSVSTVVENGVVTAGVVTIVDITERKRAEEDVRASEARFRAIFEQAGAGIAQVGTDGRWLRVNERLCEITGYTKEELLARTFQDITPREDLERDLAAARRLLRGEIESYSTEKRYLRKDGLAVWVDLTVSLVHTATGAPDYFVTVVEDISARKRAEERLRLLREASDTLVASIDFEETLAVAASLLVPRFVDWCSIFLREPDGRIRRIEAEYADPAKRDLAEEVQRYTATSARRATVGVAAVLRTGQPQLYPDVPDEFWQAIAQGPEHLATLRRLRFVSLMFVPLRARGQTLGVVALATAESGRRLDADDLIFAESFAERAAMAIDNARLLREAQAAEARYRGLFHGAAESIVAYGADGELIEANEAVVRLLGYDRDELKALGNRGAALLVDESIPRQVEGDLERRGTWHGELELRRKDGSIVPVEAHVTRIDLPEGPVYLGLWHDISERKARERFEHEFLGDIAHDLKNPLTAARVQAQMMSRRLQAGRLDEEATSLGLAAIAANTERMARRIDELGDIAQLRLGRILELRPERTDLVALAQQLAATWQQATERHAIRVVAAAPAVVGEWDRMRLERVLDNLLSNAVKYSPQGGPIAIRVGREDDAGGAWAVVSVRDDGIGVPAEDLPWIFERYRRAGNVAGRVAGTGIGLAGARQIVEQHGGTIGVESDEGQGTTVTVRLPL
ncbi:MAG TPA: PAS domain S-box protein [Thermomicrobiales bacterium]